MHHASDEQRSERDACGIGFVADAHGRASRQILDAALEGLANVRHRGAVAADRRTGDGAGLLLPIPPALVPGPWCGLAQVFLRDDSARGRIESACEQEGIELAGWRTVPLDPGALGDTARTSLPSIEQLVLLRPFGLSAGEAERRAYRARRRATRVPGRTSPRSRSGRSPTRRSARPTSSAPSTRTCRPGSLEVPFAIFHQRFSTNTTPSWERAQPFRLACHNGEINTIDGNRMRDAWPRDEPGVARVLDESGSDSSLLDNALELLVRGGRDVVTPPRCSCRVRGRRTRARRGRGRLLHLPRVGSLEPWDGPAAIVFTDGRVVGAALDRNGLRPLRVATADGFVVCASEAGEVPLDPSRREASPRAARPGRDGRRRSRGRSRDGRDDRPRLAGPRPYRRWLGRPPDVAPGRPLDPPDEELAAPARRRLHARGHHAARCDRRRPTATSPSSSMGDDTALPPLAGRARPPLLVP